MSVQMSSISLFGCFTTLPERVTLLCVSGCFVSWVGAAGCLAGSYSTGGTSLGLNSSGAMSVSCCSSSVGFVGTNVALFLRSVPFSDCTMYVRGEGEGVKTFPIRSCSRIQTVSPVFSLDSSLAL